MFIKSYTWSYIFQLRFKPEPYKLITLPSVSCNKIKMYMSIYKN